MGVAEVISLGSINVDISGRLSGWPGPGESLLASDFLLAGGGKAANAALQARRLGASVRLAGHIGDDRFAGPALAAVRAAGVDLRAVTAIPGGATGLTWVAVRPDGEKAIVAFSNANDCWSTDDAAALALTVTAGAAGSVLIADLEIPAEPVEPALQAARRRGFPTILDPSRTDRLTARIYPLVDYITPNAHEAHVLTGIAVHSVEEAARAGRCLIARGVGVALVKLPHGGCVLVTAQGSRHVPTAPVSRVDTTGAGDAFAGALAVGLGEGQSVDAATRLAVASSSLAILTYGAQTDYPTRPAVEEFLQRMPPSAALP